MIYQNVCEMIGNTPILKLNKIEEKFNLKNELYAKLEKVNPGGSIKDRVAYKMIEKAISEQKINKETVILEASSGNTGIGLAMVCAYYGLKLIIVMAKGVSKERIKILKEYGAKVILTSRKKGLKGAINKVYDINKKIKNSYYIDQFSNDSNVCAHYEGTGNEIIESMKTDIDVVFVGMGSCGTIMGISKKLKELKKNIVIIGVEPATCAFYSRGRVGKYNIPGIGGTFIPKIFSKDSVDKIVLVKDDESRRWKNIITKEEGLFVGISSGATLAAVMKYIEQEKIENKKILLIFPDGGERYLSCKG